MADLPDKSEVEERIRREFPGARRGERVDIQRPGDGSIWCIAIYQGQHVCWECFEPFRPPFKPYNLDVAGIAGRLDERIQIAVHPGCIAKHHTVTSDLMTR